MINYDQLMNENVANGSTYGYSSHPLVNQSSNDPVLNDLMIQEFTTRIDYFRRMLDPRRDIDAECGFPKGELLAVDYQEMYDYDSIANRVVEVLPREMWQITPFVYEKEEGKIATEFEQRFDEIGAQLLGMESYYNEEEGSSFWDLCLQADINCGIGKFGIFLLGIDDGLDYRQPVDGINPDDVVGMYSAGQGQYYDYLGYSGSVQQPNYASTPKMKRSTKPHKLLFMRVYPESLVQITKYESRMSSPRFGRPVEYLLTFNDPRQSMTGIGLPMGTLQVHWTRVVHIVDNPTANPVIGMPRMQPVRKQILSLMKLYGGSGEMYWKGAFPGIHLGSQEGLGGQARYNKGKMRDMLEQYFNGLQRYMVTTGFNASMLSPTVVDPAGFIDVQIQGICIKIPCPQRVFLGSERGELASTEDDAKWNDVLRARMRHHGTPRVLCPLVNRLIWLDVLPEPKDGYKVHWPDLDSQTDAEKANIASTRAMAMSTYAGMGNVGSLMSPTGFLTHEMGFDEDEAEALLEEAKASQAEQQQQQMDQQQQMIDAGLAPDPTQEGQEGAASQPGQPTTNTLHDFKKVGDFLRKSPLAMPGYGQIFVNDENEDPMEEVWYVGGDGDERDFHKLVESKLKEIGAKKVRYESEGFPPEDQSWVQVYPKKRAWVSNAQEHEIELGPRHPSVIAHGLSTKAHEEQRKLEENKEVGSYGHYKAFWEGYPEKTAGKYGRTHAIKAHRVAKSAHVKAIKHLYRDQNIYNCQPGQIREAKGRCGPGIGVSISRDKMPQIPTDSIHDFIQFAKERGVGVVDGFVTADELSPTQGEFRQSRVDGLPDHALSLPILVSADDYILDGTHRWVKHWQLDSSKQIPILRLKLPLYDALDLIREFPDAKYAENVWSEKAREHSEDHLSNEGLDTRIVKEVADKWCRPDGSAKTRATVRTMTNDIMEGYDLTRDEATTILDKALDYYPRPAENAENVGAQEHTVDPDSDHPSNHALEATNKVLASPHGFQPDYLWIRQARSSAETAQKHVLDGDYHLAVNEHARAIEAHNHLIRIAKMINKDFPGKKRRPIYPPQKAVIMHKAAIQHLSGSLGTFNTEPHPSYQALQLSKRALSSPLQPVTAHTSQIAQRISEGASHAHRNSVAGNISAAIRGHINAIEGHESAIAYQKHNGFNKGIISGHEKAVRAHKTAIQHLSVNNIFCGTGEGGVTPAPCQPIEDQHVGPKWTTLGKKDKPRSPKPATDLVDVAEDRETDYPPPRTTKKGTQNTWTPQAAALERRKTQHTPNKLELRIRHELSDESERKYPYQLARVAHLPAHWQLEEAPRARDIAEGEQRHCYNCALDKAKKEGYELHAGVIVEHKDLGSEDKPFAVKHAWGVKDGKIHDFVLGSKRSNNFHYIGEKLNPHAFNNSEELQKHITSQVREGMGTKNAFCPTGEGGGKDNECGSNEGQQGPGLPLPIGAKITKVRQAYLSAKAATGRTFVGINDLRKHLTPLVEGELTDERLAKMIKAHEHDHQVHMEIARRSKDGKLRYGRKNIGTIRILPKRKEDSRDVTENAALADPNVIQPSQESQYCRNPMGVKGKCTNPRFHKEIDTQNTTPYHSSIPHLDADPDKQHRIWNHPDRLRAGQIHYNPAHPGFKHTAWSTTTPVKDALAKVKAANPEAPHHDVTLTEPLLRQASRHAGVKYDPSAVGHTLRFDAKARDKFGRGGIISHVLPPSTQNAWNEETFTPHPREAHLHAEVAKTKKLGGGVNDTHVITMHNGVKAVWKPKEGERTGYRPNVPDKTNYRRETAASHVAHHMGLDHMVPITTTRHIGGKEGSAQEFVPHATIAHGVSNPMDGKENKHHAAAFDYVIGQTDRHHGNWMLTHDQPKKGIGHWIKSKIGGRPKGNNLKLIDNGLSFPTHERGRHDLQDSEFLRHSVKDKIPDMSHLEGKWHHIEKGLHANKIEPEAIAGAKNRFHALISHSKQGKTFGDLPYGGDMEATTVGQHVANRSRY